MKNPMRDLPVIGQEFNLAGERGIDPERVARERAEAERANAEARAYQARMQRSFEDCPGFIGGDMPAGPDRQGRVIIDPARVAEAYLWLRRRFKVSENLELSRELDNGLCVTVMSKPARKPAAGWRKSSGFAVKPHQFELPLE